MTHTSLGITQVVLGIILVTVGGFLIIALLTGGGPILPQVIGGPIIVAVIGTILLVFRKKAK